MTDEELDTWREIVYRGVENDELDYKGPQNWNNLSRVGKAKFVRHCLALANTKGGYIVIGVSEDATGRPDAFLGLTESQLKSFDPTSVGNFINRFADPAIDFDIVKPRIAGRSYAVLVVRRFRDLPHVCAQSCENELQQGAFYIRTQDAASRVAYRASELHGLVQRALRNQRESLGRMLRGILYENRQGLEPDAEQNYAEQLKRSRGFIKGRAEANPSHPSLEITCYPDSFQLQRFSLSEIRAAVSRSTYTFRDQPLLAVGSDEDTYFTNVALRSWVADRAIFWQAFQTGLFHYWTCLEAPAGKVHYLSVLRLVPEAIYFLGQFYEELGMQVELMTFTFHLAGVENCQLLMPPGSTSRARYLCRIADIEVRKKRSAADLVADPVAHSARVIREICERFNLPAGKHGNLERELTEHLERRP